MMDNGSKVTTRYAMLRKAMMVAILAPAAMLAACAQEPPPPPPAQPAPAPAAAPAPAPVPPARG